MPVGTESVDPTTPAGISWLQFARHRARFVDRWPSVFALKLATNLHRLAWDGKADVQCVLDVGATDRVWEPLIKQIWPQAEYRSLDIDRTNRHDYYSLDDVDRKFDLVTCLEVLEHLTPKGGLELMRGCIRATALGGHVLASVPNIHAAVYQPEFTHQTAYTYSDLAGLMAYLGLEVIDGRRVFLASARHRIIHQYIAYPLHRLMGIDFCQCIAILAKRVN